MSEEIIKVLDVLAEKFGIAIDWTSANIIPYLEQLCNKYVNYEITTSIISLLFGIGCLIFGRVLFKTMKHWYRKSNNMDADNGYTYGCVVSCICCGAVIIIGLSLMIGEIFDIATCLIFPEKIIIDELKSIYTTSMNGCN